MRWMMFVSSPESAWAAATPKQQEETFARYATFTEEMKKAGIFLGGESLQPTSKGARVSVRDGQPTVENGPFAEPKSALGGYYMIQVNSRDEAIEWASKCPGASYGTMEVREVTEFG